MVIPSTVKNEDLAYKFISFMLRHDNAKANSIYVGYSSPIESVYNELVMPGEEFADYKDYYIVNYNKGLDEIYRFNPQMTVILNDYWIKLKLS